MSILKIFKIAGIIVVSWAVILTVQNSAVKTNMTSSSIDENSVVQNSKIKVPPIHSMLNTLKASEKTTLPCDNTQLHPNIICDAYVLSKLKSTIEADALIGLQYVWRFFENYKNNSGIKNNIKSHTQSKDFRIAKLSKFILRNLNGETMLDNPVPIQQVMTNETESYQVLTDSSTRGSMLDEEPQYNTGDIQQIMSSGDTFIRLKAVEIATLQADNHAINLLKQAAKDPNTEVRHMAVAGLSIFIERGLADPQDILNSLEDNRSDSDIEIAGFTKELFERYSE